MSMANFKSQYEEDYKQILKELDPNRYLEEFENKDSKNDLKKEEERELKE